MTSSGSADGPCLPTQLALGKGQCSSRPCALPIAPEVLLVNDTDRHHPARAGLALHLGAVLGLPAVGSPPGHWSPKGPWPTA